MRGVGFGVGMGARDGGFEGGVGVLDAGVCGREEVGEAGGRRGGRVVGADGERVLWLLDDTMSFFFLSSIGSGASSTLAWPLV